MAIDFSLTPELEAIRAQVRTFVNDVIRPGGEIIDGKGDKEALTGEDRLKALIGMRKQARAEGLWLPHMPEEWGGMGLDHVEPCILEQAEFPELHTDQTVGQPGCIDRYV